MSGTSCPCDETSGHCATSQSICNHLSSQRMQSSPCRFFSNLCFAHRTLSSLLGSRGKFRSLSKDGTAAWGVSGLRVSCSLAVTSLAFDLLTELAVLETAFAQTMLFVTELFDRTPLRPETPYGGEGGGAVQNQGCAGGHGVTPHPSEKAA